MYPSARAPIPTTGRHEQFILVHPVVELEGVLVVREVMFGQFFVFMLCFDPVKQLRSFCFLLGISGLVTPESFVVSFFSLRDAFGSLPERKQA